MEENDIVSGAEKKFTENKNLKPFLSVFIILLIILSGYYFIWRNITIKMKNIIANSIQNFKYDSITVSGFPFSKKVKVNNITFSNSVFLMTKNQVNVKEILFSSFIFSGNLDIKFKDVSTFSTIDSTIYSLSYNEEPDINIGFYSDGRLKNFSYSDAGYRVVSNENKTLYRSDKSSLNIQSIRDNNTIDYAISGDLQNMQNISIIEKDNEVVANIEPEIYNMKFDASSSITKVDNELEESIIKINNISLLNAKDTGITISGEIKRDTADPYSYGEVKATLSNYAKLFASYKKDVIEALSLENDMENISKKEKAEYISMTNNLFDVIDSVVRKNPETNNNTGVIVISRAKNTPDYVINGESLFGIIQRIISTPKKK